MRFAVFSCPGCRFQYDGVLRGAAFALECPVCHQMNLAQRTSPAVTGRCDLCGQPLDSHIYGRLTFCCPPQNRRAT